VAVHNPTRARPNVVLVSLDTVRPDHLGCYGYDRNTSPRLDALARRSVLFERVRCQAPWTLPSHMSLFTSLRPCNNHVEDINQKLSPEIPLLAEILEAHGYHTGALVNNGQMKPHWGFARGFKEWREFEVNTPEGSCENITREAVRWLQQPPTQPFFLFLHYFDAHDPYAPPEPYRTQFGVTLSSDTISQAVWAHRLPGKDITDPELMRQIVGAYDGEIARLDASLGRLFDALPTNTLLVVFSDHGEAFEEHGWTTHGASLYEEEIRTVLILRPPQPAASARRVSTPVMLLDVAPTVLEYCAIDPPAHYEGLSLRPDLTGVSAGERRRLHFSATKRVLEGRILDAAIDEPFKLIYSLGDGNRALHRLPDEQTDRWASDPDAALRLTTALRERVPREAYWMVHVAGRGRHDVSMRLTNGRVSVFVPFGIETDCDGLRCSDDGRQLVWECYPDRRPKTLFLQTWPPEAPLTFDVHGPEGTTRQSIHLAVSSGQWVNPDGIPFSFPDHAAPADPYADVLFPAQQDGVYIRRYRAIDASGHAPQRTELDDETLRQLRSLGYVQ